MYDIDTLKRLRIGTKGENLTHPITIDCTSWIEAYPNGILSLFYQPNGETELTAVACETGDGYLTWDVTDTDTSKTGAGHCEVRMYDMTTNALKKSRTIITIVDPDIEGDEDASAPSAMTQWQNRLAVAEGTALQAAAAATKAAQTVVDQANDLLTVEKLRVIEDPDHEDYIEISGGYDFSAAEYPVGSIYMSVGSITPASIFGGTWEKITDTFLVGAGTNRPVLTQGGGTGEVTLTMEQLPEEVQS